MQVQEAEQRAENSGCETRMQAQLDFRLVLREIFRLKSGKRPNFECWVV